MANAKLTQIDVEENFEFSCIIRNKANVGSPAYDSLHQRSGDFKTPYNFSKKLDTALKKENLFRTYGTVIYTSQPHNYLQTSLSTGEADVVGDGELYPMDGNTFSSTKSMASKIGALTKLLNSFVYDNKFNV